MNITVYGNDKRCLCAKRLLDEKDIPGLSKVILLPTPTTKDGVHITDTGEELLYIFSNLTKGDLVFGYGIGEEFLQIAKERGAVVFDLCRDEELLLENARLTALGALGKILTKGNLAPEDMRIGIVGFGRIGKELAKMLTFHGARLVIFTSKPKCAEELRLVGILGALTVNLAEGESADILSELDLLINTAPAKIINDRLALGLKGSSVIELASGKNLPDSLQYESLPGIPGRMYPESAGRILANRIERCLKSYEE